MAWTGFQLRRPHSIRIDSIVSRDEGGKHAPREYRVHRRRALDLERQEHTRQRPTISKKTRDQMNASPSAPVAVPAGVSKVDLNSTAQLLGSSPRDLLIGASPRKAGLPKSPSKSTFSQALPVCLAIEEENETDDGKNGVDSIAEELGKVGLITHNLAKALEITEPDAGTKERVTTIINAYKEKLASRTSTHMGYPYNLDFDYGPLECLQKFMINNLGDPFIESNYGVHSREFEIGVLNWFAKLWEIEREDFWGYVTNCGTEGNLHGILVGRETLPDGILYSSVETHYSVFKAARMYRMDAVEIDTLESGEMDYAHFRAKLMENQDRPAIVNVNIGTTVRGAVDDLDKVLAILDECGFDESNFYIHCDGALFGMMIPFVKKAPKVSFKKPIGSVSVSGHKFVGAPVPCGVVMTRLKLIKSVSSDVEYLNSRDATIMGSRNGHAPIYLWYTLTMKVRTLNRGYTRYLMVRTEPLSLLVLAPSLVVLRLCRVTLGSRRTSSFVWPMPTV